MNNNKYPFMIIDQIIIFFCNIENWSEQVKKPKIPLCKHCSNSYCKTIIFPSSNNYLAQKRRYHLSYIFQSHSWYFISIPWHVQGLKYHKWHQEKLARIEINPNRIRDDSLFLKKPSWCHISFFIVFHYATNSLAHLKSNVDF